MECLGFFLLSLIALIGISEGLNNGLALTPPMGWLSWERFRCNPDCENYPDSCISERLYMAMADRMVEDGYREAGYEYVNIDACWTAPERDPHTMALVADPKRFPSGMKKLADYMHNRGLKLGIYSDIGTKTCAGGPGSKFNLEQDARTFAEWEVDSLKLDCCNIVQTEMTDAYPVMGFYLNQTGRHILYSCSWPACLIKTGTPDYVKIAKYCNIWRNYNDIDDSWDKLKNIIKFFGDDAGNFSAVSGPGNFNDPDMILIGDTGMSYQQWEVQMGMWAIMASPLLMSNDLRHITPEAKALLQHRGVIAINQDPLGIMGKRIWQRGDHEAWLRPIVPRGSYAVAVLNLSEIGYAVKFTVSLEGLGVKDKGPYDVTNVFTGEPLGVFSNSKNMTIYVDTHSILLLNYQRL